MMILHASLTEHFFFLSERYLFGLLRTTVRGRGCSAGAASGIEQVMDTDVDVLKALDIAMCTI